jgi:hypothetical protein
MRKSIEAGHVPDAVSVNVHTPKRSSSLGVVSLILGVLGFLLSWVPLVGILTLPLSMLGLLLGAIGVIVALVRRGSGMGWPIAGVVTCGVAFLIAASQVAVIGGLAEAAREKAERSRQTNQTPVTSNLPYHSEGSGIVDDANLTNDSSESAPEQDSPDLPESSGEQSLEWASAEQPVRQGDVQVRVVRVVEEQTPLKRLGDDTRSENELLSVYLEVQNLSTSKKLNYKTWQGAQFSVGRDHATLMDNFGNAYKRINFGFGMEIVGQVSTDSLYPNKSLSDVLVFELPIDNTEHLDLELPADNFGGDGMLRIRIPRKMYGGPSAEELAQQAAEREAAYHAARAKREAAKQAELQRLASLEKSKFRTWTSRKGGHATEAKIISYALGIVTMENRDGKKLKVPVDKLSEEDGRYIEEWRSDK